MYQAITIWLFTFCLVLGNALNAQPVLYTPNVGKSLNANYEVIGKVGSFYWAYKMKEPSLNKKEIKSRKHELTLDLYDARLHLIKEIPYNFPDSIIKEYLVAGDRYFDQLFFRISAAKISVLLNRFSQDGSSVASNLMLKDLPAGMKPDDFLLVRSQDKSKLLLLGFEPMKDGPPHMHTILFDDDWKILLDTVYKKGNVAQPYLQLEPTSYPLEPYNNSPVQVANNGDWLMVAPSRIRDNYLLCHFRLSDSAFMQSEIKQSQGHAVQYSSLSLDNETGTAIAGMLISEGSSSFKKVRLTHYVLAASRMDRDTTFLFTTPKSNNAKEAHIYEEDFIPVPGKGFMYLKEYGRTFQSASTGIEGSVLGKEVWPDSIEVKQQILKINKSGYTRLGSFAVTKKSLERGDLYVYYFSALRIDSCWSGLINVAQSRELNSSFLSYACLPVKDRIFVLYNHPAMGFEQVNSATILDPKGYLLDEDLMFWKGGNIMNFQRFRQIGSGELAVFYQRNRVRGFAIIRL